MKRKESTKERSKEKPRAAPAKITPPRLPAVFPRTRLFRELDRARRHTVVWIAAPAGYGKTTLVASYLKARELPTLWYQLDEGDADIASYFHYLGLAARRTAPRVRWSLPPFTPEYFANLPVFARRTFERIAAGLPERTVAVLDNYQDVRSEAALHEVLHDGFSQIPDGMNLIILSRHEPPPVYAADRANGVMVVLGEEQLRLTEQESFGICKVHRAHTDQGLSQTSRQLHERAHGWAAGLVLMMEQGQGSQRSGTAPPDAPQHVLFDYFCREVFAKADLETQQLLLSTAFLPMVSPAAAEELSESSRAGDILTRLHRGNFFTSMRAAPGKVYEYHPLLRDFLAVQIEQLLPRAERTRLARRSAELLQREGRVEDAAQLLQTLGDWQPLTALIKQHAPAFLERGSHRTVSAWLDRLPPEVCDGDPWLLFWLGTCRLPFDTTEARELFTRAYAEFRARGDASGVFYAWASAVEAIVFEWDDFSQLSQWTSDLEQLLLLFPTFPSPQIEARVVGGMFAALMFHQPQHPQIGQWCRRLEQLVDQTLDPSARILLGTHLFVYRLVWLGELAAAEKTLLCIRPARGAKLSPVTEVLWQSCFASWCWMNNWPEKGLVAVAEAQRVSEAHGLTLWSFIANSAGVDIHLSGGNLAEASPYLARLEQLLTPRRRIDQGHYLMYTSWTATLRGEHERALAVSGRVLAVAGQNAGGLQVCNSELAYAQTLQATGQSGRALAHASRARRLGEEMCSPLIRYEASYREAWILFESGAEAEGCEHLRTAFALGREQDYARLTSYFNDPSIFAKLCARALESGIEVDYALSMIRERGLVPPAAAPVPESWPLPIKIHTLGRFSLLLQGKPVKFSGKTQKKPLELLKTIIALGGRDVCEGQLAEALWPDADADAAANSLTSTLHRLRALVGPDAIQRQAGRVSLDSRRCWVDAWSFERQLTILEKAHRDHDLDASGLLSEKLAHQYRGAFLENDFEHRWVLSTRERLRARFLRVLELVGAALAQAHRLELAFTCFSKAIEIDPLAESCHRGLMQLSLTQGRHAEVLSTYHRCRTLLFARLGCAPSQETEALVAQVAVG